MKKLAGQDHQNERSTSLFLFHGDEFLVKEQVHRIVDNTLAQQLRETNLVVLDGGRLDLAELSTQLFTSSLFGDARVVVVEQTTAFMGRTDQTKLVTKVMDSWKAGDRKAAFKVLSQLLSLAGVDAEELRQAPESVADVFGDAVLREDRGTLTLVSREFLAEGKVPESRTDEAVLEEIILSDLPEGTLLIFTAAVVDKRKKLFKVVEQRGRVVECAAREEKYGTGLERSFFDERVRSALSAAGKTIAGRALEKMYSRSGKELRQLHSELQKLIGYLGPRTEVTEQDVESVFSDFHEAAFFELNGAIRTGDIRKCLPALHENLKVVSHPLQTLASMANEVRKLMVARELLFTVFRSSWQPGMAFPRFKGVLQKVREENPGLMKKGKFQLLSGNDYALYLYLKDAQKFTMEKLLRSLEALLETDILMKSTRMGSHAPQALLEKVLFEICSDRQASR
ncbi:MAG: hypothetical protein HY914_20115 [Desulfomonile tiedjei]|nr:hypothetical protein [Desulfomonile tiedjei]